MPADPTKQSCLCRVCLGGVNWILDNSRLSPTENMKSEHVNSNCPFHTGTPDTTVAVIGRRKGRDKTVLSCRVSARPPDRCVLCRVGVGVRRVDGRSGREEVRRDAGQAGSYA